MKGSAIKIMIILVILMSAGKLKAQFSIYAFQPPPSFSLDDLWNLNIMLNGTSQFEEYFITLEFIENRQGKVAECRTKQFKMKSNLLTINKSDYESYVDKSSANYLNTEFYFKCSQSGGRVPPGNYTAKYTFWGIIDDPVTGRVIENLLAYDLEIVEYSAYPPTLIQVYDKDTISEQLPVFSWTAPYPVLADQMIQYRIRIAELLDGQIPEEAIQSNPVFMETEQNQVTVLNYPVYGMTLTEGQCYAWQVSAYSGTDLLGRSEVWSFCVKQPGIMNEPPPEAVRKSCDAVLSDHPGQVYSQLKAKKISFRFPKDVHVDKALSFRIFDADKKMVRLSSDKMSKSENGLYEIQSENLLAGVYMLEVQMERAKYYLRFKID